MTRFKSCAKVAHAKLRTFFPEFTLGQAQQVLASALGHKRYASFLETDSSAFDERAAFAVLDSAAAMLRASEMGTQMNRDHWSLLIDEINDKQVAGELEMLEHVPHVGLSAIHAFLKLEDPQIDEVLRAHGGEEKFRRITREMPVTRARIDHNDSLPPAIMSAHVEAEIGVERTGATVSVVPMEVEFVYERVGRHLYSSPVLLSVVQRGPVRVSHLEDEFDGGMTFGP